MTTREPDSYMLAQGRAFESGRKPAILVTDRELVPPIRARVKRLPEGLLLYKDRAVLDLPLGLALGYGISYKPITDTVLTVREASGQIIHEVLTDGSIAVENAGWSVAGLGGWIEYRHILTSMLDRHGSIDRIVEELTCPAH